MKNFFKQLIVWIWCFPQMLLGYIIKYYTKAEKANGFYKWTYKGGMSLGTYIFLCPAYYDNENILKHEQGHTKQSYILGWLYLIVIALPSLIWCNCFEKYRKKHKISYYSFYTEAWANKLSGIDL